MKKKLFLGIVLMVVLTACNGGPRPTPSDSTYPDGFLQKGPDPAKTPDRTIKTPESNA